MTFGEQVLHFHFSLKPDWQLPPAVELLYPYDDPATRAAMTDFYTKYFSDKEPRIYLFGINPGRFGAGVTGVPFTGPVRLATDCGIPNDFPKRPELSGVFIYDVIHAYGGPEHFYRHFYITSLSPLGFVKGGKNYNYYDEKALAQAVEPHIVATIRQQLTFGAVRRVALCLGEGQNFRYFQRLNDQHGFFETIIPLPHPRYVMQYKRRYLEAYRDQYLEALDRATGTRMDQD